MSSTPSVHRTDGTKTVNSRCWTEASISDTTRRKGHIAYSRFVKLLIPSHTWVATGACNKRVHHQRPTTIYDDSSTIFRRKEMLNYKVLCYGYTCMLRVVKFPTRFRVWRGDGGGQQGNGSRERNQPKASVETVIRGYLVKHYCSRTQTSSDRCRSKFLKIGTGRHLIYTWF